jgi:hypothetical protein
MKKIYSINLKKLTFRKVKPFFVSLCFRLPARFVFHRPPKACRLRSKASATEQRLAAYAWLKPLALPKRLREGAVSVGAQQSEASLQVFPVTFFYKNHKN